MINRVGFNKEKGSVLLAQITEREKEILAWAIGKNPHLSRYYFMQMFEVLEAEQHEKDYDSSLNLHIESIEIGDKVEDKDLYPVRADLKITLSHYNALRAPFRQKSNALPEFQRIDLKSIEEPKVETVKVSSAPKKEYTDEELQAINDSLFD